MMFALTFLTRLVKRVLKNPEVKIFFTPSREKIKKKKIIKNGGNQEDS